MYNLKNQKKAVHDPLLGTYKMATIRAASN